MAANLFGRTKGRSQEQRLGNPLTAMRYVMFFRFYGSRRVSVHNGENGPESKTTRMIRQVRQTAALIRRQTTLFGRYRQVAVPKVKSAVSDYNWFS